MADYVPVMAGTLVCDGKRRLGEGANFSDGRFLLPSLKEASRLAPVYCF
jgi:hypothetical protein